MGVSVAYVLAAIMAVGATVCAFIFILPEKKAAKLPKFLRMVADILNFKDLLLEKIMKVLYVFATAYCLMAGFFMLFSGYRYGWTFRSTALEGLLVMFIGPIVVRLAFEGIMMFILLVKNTIEINKKLPKKADDAVVVEAEPVEEAPAPEMVFCTQCGTRYDKNAGGCPNGCQQ